MRRKPDLWQVLVPVIAIAAGLLFATTAHTARGTDLRSAGNSNIAELIRGAEQSVSSYSAQLNTLQSEVAAQTNVLAQSDAGIAAINDHAKHLIVPVGLSAMTGPGLSVTLDDAHGTPTDPNVNLNRLVVHQSDMQALVNALWKGGAEAIAVMGQRLISTSAIRCVGPTLLLNGRVFSPPYSVAAIGPEAAMRSALDSSPGLIQYREDARFYGLGYKVDSEDKINVPAYGAPIGLNYAQAGQ